MIYQKIKNGTETELKEISFEEAFHLAGTTELVFDSQTEEIEFYKKVLKKCPMPNAHPKKEKADILDILPYLDEDDIHEIVQSILNGEEEYQNINLNEFFPYLSEEDADVLFLKGIESNANIDPVELAPYISEKAFTAFVDEYIKGNYQDVDIDGLYPYMNSSDIKRLFKYFLSKRSN